MKFNVPFETFSTPGGITGIQIRHANPIAQVTFVHGLGGTASQFQDWMTACYLEDLEVRAINLRGHADSRRNADLGRTSFHDYRFDVETMTSIMGCNHNCPTYLVGHSMGGLVAQTVASTTDLYHGLILVSTAPPAGILLRGQVLWRMLRPCYLKAMIQSKPFIADPADVEYFGLSGVRSPESGRWLREFALHRINVDPEKIRHGRRLMMISGAEDRLIVPAVQTAIARKLNPNQNWVVPGKGHMIHLEDGNRKVIKDIIDWIK